MGVAPLSISRLTATSPLHGITLDADLCEIDWPEGCFDEARFVPNRWWTVDLEGAEEALAKLPPGPREERHPGLVRWTFNGDELDTGEAARCFQRMAAALSQSGSPYR